MKRCFMISVMKATKRPRFSSYACNFVPLLDHAMVSMLSACIVRWPTTATEQIEITQKGRIPLTYLCAAITFSISS